MQFIGLDKEEVLQAAKAAFPDKYIDVDRTNFYVRDISSGTIHIDGVEEPLYVSTNYVYEDHIINGNNTRFKSQLTTVTLKKDAYDVIYDSYGVYYVAYKEDTIQFVRYEDFYDRIKENIHLQEENQEA